MIVFTRRLCAAVVVGVAVLGAPATATARQPLPGCAQQVSPPARPRPLVSGELLPAAAVEMRLCRYTVSPSHGLQVQKQSLIRTRADLARINRRLNALPGPPPGPTTCPNVDGPVIIARARLADGRLVKLTIDTRGCSAVQRMVRRGAIVRDAYFVKRGRDLVRELERLTN